MAKSLTDCSSSLDSDEFIWLDDGESSFHKWILPVLDEFIARIRPETAVDIGCGNGYVSNHLHEQGIVTVGIDSSRSGIEIARRTYPSQEFVHSDIIRPIDAMSGRLSDCAIALDIIEHLFTPRDLFARCRELLKPGGHLILSTPYHGYWKNLALALTNSFDQHWHPLRDHGHIKFFSIKTLTILCDEEGFTIVDLRRVGRLPLIAKSTMMLLRYNASGRRPYNNGSGLGLNEGVRFT